jgi:hypothetical protein
MDWAELFERAATRETDVAAIRDRLAARRAGEEGGEDRE